MVCINYSTAQVSYRSLTFDIPLGWQYQSNASGMNIDAIGQQDIPLSNPQIKDVHPMLLQGTLLKSPLIDCISSALDYEWGRSAKHGHFTCIVINSQRMSCALRRVCAKILQVLAPVTASISGKSRWRCTFGVLKRTPGYTLVEEQYRKRLMDIRPVSVRIYLNHCRSESPSSVMILSGIDVLLWLF